MLTSLGATSIFMLPQITLNQRYEWVGFYVNLSTLCLKYYDHSTVYSFCIINMVVNIGLNIDRRYLERQVFSAGDGWLVAGDRWRVHVG